MMAFIEQQREVYGVEPVCTVLPIAPSTYYRCKHQGKRPERQSARMRRDNELKQLCMKKTTVSEVRVKFGSN